MGRWDLCVYPSQTDASITGGGMQQIVKGLTDSLSIGAAYLPIAFSFGLAALEAGFSPAAAVLLSALVFAGASQFVMLALMATGTGMMAVVVTVLLMNVRHLFYGPALLAKLGSGRPSWPTPLLAFGLTDEVFATASGKLGQIPLADREGWYVGLQVGAYSIWVLGTALGAMFGRQLSAQSAFWSDAMSFVLPALFLALLLEIAAQTRWLVLLGAALTTTAALPFMPAYLALLLGMVAGAALGYRRGVS